METLIISAILPAVIDLFKNGLKAASDKWIGLSVDDQIKLMDADVKRVEALAQLDNPYGTPSQWIVDLRAAFRYVAAGALIVGGLGTIAYGLGLVDAVARNTITQLGIELASAPFAFIFGERLLLTLKGGFK